MKIPSLAVVLAFACAAAPNQDSGQARPQKPRKLDELPLPSEKNLGKRAYDHVRNIVAFGPRLPGSKASKKAADYICARLKALGLKPIREAWHDKQEKLDFENVRVRVPGRSKKTILIGTHYDTKVELSEKKPPSKAPFTGANDGGSGTGLMLALIEDLVSLKLRKPTLEFVWFDGEESIPPSWDVDRALFGSKEFVKRHLEKGHSYGCLVLLDMVGSKDLKIDRETTSTEALYPPFEKAVKALGYDKYFFQRTTSVDDDHVPFLDAGLPSIDLIQFEDNPEWHTHDDTMDVVSPKSLAIVGRVVLRALPGVEALYGGGMRKMRPKPGK